MLKINNKMLVSLLIALPLLLNTGISKTVSASSIDNNSTAAYTYDFYAESLETRLDTLVESEIISQSQAAKILDIYYNYEITTKHDMKDQLEVLLEAGTITQNQEYSILNLFMDINSN